MKMESRVKNDEGNLGNERKNGIIIGKKKT